MDIASKVKLGANGVATKDPRASAKYTEAEFKEAKKEALIYASLHGLNPKEPRDLADIREVIWERLAHNREYNTPEAVAERKRLKDEAEGRRKLMNAMNPAQKKAYLATLLKKKQAEEDAKRPKREIDPNEEEKNRIYDQITRLDKAIEARREYHDFEQKKSHIEIHGNAEGFRPNRELSEISVKYEMEKHFKKIDELYDEINKLEK
jgi:phenylalanyl-tRNA synthetase alpha subunit